jgi:hypothetical protein
MAATSDGVTVIEDGEILVEKDMLIPLADGHILLQRFPSQPRWRFSSHRRVHSIRQGL